MLPTGVTRGIPNPLHYKLPERLRRRRKTQKLTASGLCAAAKVERETVAQLEEGSRVPRVLTAERLADALQVSAGWLCFGLDSPWTASMEPRCGGMAARLQEARSGLAIKELARKADTSPAEVRQIERGSMPTLGTVEQIARALGVSPAWLAFGELPREIPRRGVGSARSNSRALAPYPHRPAGNAIGE